ncbi:MAG TPA: hypothetical protein ENK18_18240 [Deltaproteobacteria bacterium]|nr:hypothetical protein [Deltaproteobacteria bacterium]
MTTNNEPSSLYQAVKRLLRGEERNLPRPVSAFVSTAQLLAWLAVVAGGWLLAHPAGRGLWLRVFSVSLVLALAWLCTQLDWASLLDGAP